MGLLWVLVLLLIIFALIGGFAVNHWLLVILLIALILLLVGYVSAEPRPGRVSGVPGRRCRRASASSRGRQATHTRVQAGRVRRPQ
jgi:hypothetical protein